MSLWKVETDEEFISFGEKRRKKTNAKGCNEPFKGRYWCPRLRWFAKAPCPFLNRQECDSYRRQCGAL
jgi:hypothetical protein